MSEEFVQNNKILLLGKLTAGLIHEIRNPLTVIKLNLDYMKMLNDELSKEALESVDSSLEAFERIHFLIEDVLDFTRKSNNRINRISLHSVTDKCLDIIGIDANKKNIVIEKNIPDDLPTVRMNENKMLQVFLNLLNNAVEASKPKSKIFLNAYVPEANPKTVIWEVCDHGCGISEDDRAKILKGFYTSKSEGNGIGLAVCKMLLDEVEAEMNFDSEVGNGTRFFITFKLD